MNKNQPKKETNEFTQVWFKEIKSVDEAAEKYVSRIFANRTDDEVAQIARWDFMSGADYVLKALKKVLNESPNVEDIRSVIGVLQKKNTKH